MFGLNYSMHYYLCTRCVDMRNGINGLSKIVRDEMGLAPLGGGILYSFPRTGKASRYSGGTVMASFSIISVLSAARLRCLL